MHGLRSKIPSEKSCLYIYDIKFLALLGAQYIYDISRLRVNCVKQNKLHQNVFFAGCVCDVQIICDWFGGIQWFLAPHLSTEADNPKSLGLNAWTGPQIGP
jgi:hypothetical protein